MSTGRDSKGGRGVMSEINVTPLVDVMLVLLIIFMVAAGVQTVEIKSDSDRLLQEAQDQLEEAEDLLAEAERKVEKLEKVTIDLPKVNSEPIVLSDVKKLKLQVDGKLVFRIGRRKILDCLKVSPEMSGFLGAGGVGAEESAMLAAFEPCLKALGAKLVDNKKLQEDGELYILADRTLDYGLVLRVMAAVRQAGVTKFGLVAEPDILGGAAVDKTPPAVP